MCNWMVTFTTNSFLQPILCVKMPSHALGAHLLNICCQKNPGIVYGRTKYRLRACWWAPGDRAFAHRVQAWLGPKNPGFGGGVVELSLWLRSCERWRRWHKTNPGLVIFGQSSGKPKSAPSAGSDGRLTSHFGHIKRFEIRDKWSGAKSSRCLCRLVWQAWLSHCFIRLWYSHRRGRGKAELTHNLHNLSRETRPFFLWFVSKKKKITQ